MEDHTIKCISIFIFCCLLSLPVVAKHDSHHPLTEDDWLAVKANIELLDEMNYLPTLLPTIMRNSDTLQLTSQQIAGFRDWRKKNYTNMTNVMNEIIALRIEFKKVSLDPSTSNNDLVARQNEIFLLQKELLGIKLSCRRLLVQSFTEDQWSNFAFVVSDDPKLASFIQ